MEAVFTNWLLLTKKIEKPEEVMTDKLAELKREFNTMEIQRCYITNDRGEPIDFTFYVESVGTQSIPFIVSTALRACTALVRKYEDLDATIPESVTLKPGDARYSCTDVVFQGEAHTLGNLLEAYLVENHVDGSAQPRITYAGYKVPHPLRAEMFVRIGAEQDMTNNIATGESEFQMARQAISSVCRGLRDQFRQLDASWAGLFAPPPTPTPTPAVIAAPTQVKVKAKAKPKATQPIPA